MVSWLDKLFRNAGQKGKSPKNDQHFLIPLRLLQQATNNFDKKRLIGRGGFGEVFLGKLKGDNNETKVAVKRKNPSSSQGQKEFRVEINLLQGLDHCNLVSLIGYCDEKDEMILVYEYMEGGTLSSHLYGSDKPSLSWEQRLKISVGAAKGLHYLHALHYHHTGSMKAIIHRDIKSANILLDGNLRAKVSDFGLSKTGPELDQTHVITHVKGSFGYFDPEYCRTQQLTEKSDVYSFGVVLLEMLCGRPVIDPELPSEEVNLVDWGMRLLKEGELGQIVDQKVLGTVTKPSSLKLFGEIVSKCLAEKSAERPSMEDVLRDLEDVLDLEAKVPLKRSVATKNWRSSNVPDALGAGPSTSISADGNYSDDHDVSPENSDEPDDGVSSQAIASGNFKSLTRALAFRRDI